MKTGFIVLFFQVLRLLFSVGIIVVVAEKTVAQENRAILLYPELRAPFSNVFEEMIRGVESSFDGSIQRISVKKNTPVEQIRSAVEQASPNVVFALGARSLQFAGKIETNVPILAAGITKNGPSTVGISMLPDPKVVLDKLFLIKGKVDRVYVVSRGNRYDEQLARAEAFLTKSSSSLEPTKVNSIQEAAKAYRNILDKVKPGDAIWILPSAPYLDNSVLSVILEQAWKRRILVFSSNPSHVKRGVLFAVYPDNLRMGASLGGLGNRMIAKDDFEHGLQPLQDVLLAVNERTTKHLGIDLGEQARSEINLMLPAR